MKPLASIAVILLALAGVLGLSVTSARPEEQQLLAEFTATTQQQLHTSVEVLSTRLDALHQDTRLLVDLVERERSLDPEEVKRADPTVPVVIMTAFGGIDSAVEAMRRGAYSYVTKPFELDVLRGLVERACRERGLARENALLRRSLRENAASQRLHRRRLGEGGRQQAQGCRGAGRRRLDFVPSRKNRA